MTAPEARPAAPASRYRVDDAGLARIGALRDTLASEVGERFQREFPAFYERFGDHGRAACVEDVGYHLDFLATTLEFGALAPFADYLHWLASVLAARGIPTDHLALSLDWLAESLAAHLPPEVAGPAAAALADARTALAAARTPPMDEARVTDARPETEALVDALGAGDTRRVEAIVDAAGRDLLDIEVRLLQPALYGIGRAWQEGRISVAQEHLATAIVQAQMTRAFGRAEPASPNGRRALLACVEGNRHGVGLRMVADGLELDGWEVEFLGVDTPVAMLAERTRRFAPEIVGLSASLPQHLRGIREAIRTLRRELGAQCPRIVVGGLVINRFPALAEALGADVWVHDAREAVRRSGEA